MAHHRVAQRGRDRARGAFPGPARAHDVARAPIEDAGKAHANRRSPGGIIEALIHRFDIVDHVVADPNVVGGLGVSARDIRGHALAIGAEAFACHHLHRRRDIGQPSAHRRVAGDILLAEAQTQVIAFNRFMRSTNALPLF